MRNRVIKYGEWVFQPFPEKKPADFKNCRVLLNDDTIYDGAYRYDTGFGREWYVNGRKGHIVFDDEIKGWWYIA